MLLHIPGAIWKPQRKAVEWQDSLPVSCWLARPLPQRALAATLRSAPPIPHPRALKPPSSLVCSPLPRCSLPPHTKPTHVLSNTHKCIHSCKDASDSFPLQGRVSGRHLAFCLRAHLTPLPCTRPSSWHQLPEFSGDLPLSALRAQHLRLSPPVSQARQSRGQPPLAQDPAWPMGTLDWNLPEGSCSLAALVG